MTPIDVLIIPLLAVLAPVLVRGVSRWVRVPIVVFELSLGILVGPSVLGWTNPTDVLDTLSEFGLAMLFFVAGSEIEFAVLGGRSGRRAVGGWLISLVAGLGIGWILAPGDAAVIVAIALCSTALGMLLPILRDAGELSTPFGRSVSAIGAVGEFGPLLAISLFFGTRSMGLSTIVLVVFIVVAGAAILVAVRTPQGALHRVVNTTLHTSAQFAIRAVFLILAALVALSAALDLDMLLGAFTAGIIWRLLMRDASAPDRKAVDSKIEAIAFGFLVPVFFIYTGITFDLKALFAEPVLFALVPVAVIALLVVRGIPSLLAAPPGSSPRDRAAVVFLGATGLPIIVAVTAVGVDGALITTAQAAVLVGAGMLSVLVFPLLALTVRQRSVTSTGDLEHV